MNLPAKPCRSAVVKLFLSSLKHSLSRRASSLDIPWETSSFSKALLVLRTLHPRVEYIQKRLMLISAKLGVDFTRALTSEAALILFKSYCEERQTRGYSFSSSSFSPVLFPSFSRILFSISSPKASCALSLCLPVPADLSMSPMLVKVRM